MIIPYVQSARVIMELTEMIKIKKDNVNNALQNIAITAIMIIQYAQIVKLKELDTLLDQTA